MRFVLVVTLFLLHSITFAQSNWNQYFEACGLKGSTTIYDYQKKEWMTNDPNDSQTQTLPASTFKIVNTLIALDVKAVQDEQEIIPWIEDYDTVKYGHRPNIYHSMSMKEAFRLSAGWAYIELAKKIGKPKYKEYLTAMDYGNVDLSTEGDDFWNFGGFGISPANQIEILIRIYEETLPFSEQSFQTLKEMMIEEKTDDFIIRAKTGWTREGGKDTGWWVGYLETSENVYFFATRLIKDRSEDNPNFGSCRKTITKEIFKQLGVL